MLLIKILTVLVLLFLAVKLFFWLAPQFGSEPSRTRLENLALASRYQDSKFKNLEETPVLLPKSYSKLIRKQFKKNPGRIPEHILPSLKPDLDLNNTNPELSVIWLGHSTVLLRMEGVTIITDPVFGKRASPVSFVGPKPFPTSSQITLDDLPALDIVLISHDHFDHLDYRTIKRIHSEVKKFIVPLGVRDHLEKWGVDPEKISESDWGEAIDYSTLHFICTPARHFSGRRKQNNSTLWCSWVIQTDSLKIFYCGDSGYGNHFTDIGNQYGPFDFTLMESGAYGPYWPYIHMVPEETVRAHIDLKGRVLLPIHWGKYNLAFHPWKEPIIRLAKAANDNQITLATPVIGELVTPEKIPSVHWWEDL